MAELFANRMRAQLEFLRFFLPRYWDLRAAVFLTLAVAFPFFLTLLITSWRARRAFAVAETTAPGLKRPPTLPYAVPFLGHLFQFMRDGNSFMLNAATYCGRTVPVQIILPIFSNYVVSGPGHVTAYFKESRDLSTTSRSIKIMETAFGCPNHLLDAFKPHTPTIQPQTKSTSPPEENIEHLIRKAVNTGLSGAHLDALTARFQEYLVEQNEENAESKIGDEWTELPDLNAFVEKQVFEAAVRSMFGTYILSLNPTLANDFWNFNRNIGALFMGAPRWLNPAAYRAREKMLENIKRWQKYAHDHCDIANLVDVDWEPYYGSKFIRERQGLLTKRGILDETARAAENFAFMWATNSNSVPAATWFLLELLQDPSLKTRVSSALPAASLIVSTDGNPKKSLQVFDTTKLCSDPLLQSIYAETLRLRVAVLVVRQPAKDHFSFQGWHIKKTEILSVSTRTEAMNDEIWSTGGPENPHPLDTFWSDRFLVNPQDPSSGPLRVQKDKALKPLAASHSNQASAGTFHFSMDGLSASWIPYGGGLSLCPGRHFAKREIITTTAIFLSAFDMELVEEEGKKPEVDMSCFGFGTMPPDRKIPVRIRRRRE